MWTGRWSTWWSNSKRRMWFSAAYQLTAKWCTNSSVATFSSRWGPKKPIKLWTKNSSTNSLEDGLKFISFFLNKKYIIKKAAPLVVRILTQSETRLLLNFWREKKINQVKLAGKIWGVSIIQKIYIK